MQLQVLGRILEPLGQCAISDNVADWDVENERNAIYRQKLMVPVTVKGSACHVRVLTDDGTPICHGVIANTLTARRGWFADMQVSSGDTVVFLPGQLMVDHDIAKQLIKVGFV